MHCLKKSPTQEDSNFIKLFSHNHLNNLRKVQETHDMWIYSTKNLRNRKNNIILEEQKNASIDVHTRVLAN